MAIRLDRDDQRKISARGRASSIAQQALEGILTTALPRTSLPQVNGSGHWRGHETHLKLWVVNIDFAVSMIILTRLLQTSS